MKNIAIFLLAVAVVALGTFAYFQDASLRDLRAKLESVPKTANLELQQKCAVQARREFTLAGWDKQPMATYANHYNERLNKCFLEIKSMSESASIPGTLITNTLLSDAFEGKSYAEYLWISDKVKKYWEVPPRVCRVTLPSGEERVCQSSDEFDELIKAYME